jgi:hypothetical protein
MLSGLNHPVLGHTMHLFPLNYNCNALFGIFFLFILFNCPNHCTSLWLERELCKEIVAVFSLVNISRITASGKIIKIKMFIKGPKMKLIQVYAFHAGPDDMVEEEFLKELDRSARGGNVRIIMI